jgi:hypothetical protein
MHGPSFPDWQPLYHQAVFELDPEKLLLRVAAARKAIDSRLAKLADLPPYARERKALRDALDVLDIVLEIEGKRDPTNPNIRISNIRPAA